MVVYTPCKDIRWGSSLTWHKSEHGCDDISTSGRHELFIRHSHCDSTGDDYGSHHLLNLFCSSNPTISLPSCSFPWELCKKIPLCWNSLIEEPFNKLYTAIVLGSSEMGNLRSIFTPIEWRESHSEGVSRKIFRNRLGNTCSSRQRIKPLAPTYCAKDKRSQGHQCTRQEERASTEYPSFKNRGRKSGPERIILGIPLPSTHQSRKILCAALRDWSSYGNSEESMSPVFRFLQRIQEPLESKVACSRPMLSESCLPGGRYRGIVNMSHRIRRGMLILAFWSQESHWLNALEDLVSASLSGGMEDCLFKSRDRGMVALFCGLLCTWKQNSPTILLLQGTFSTLIWHIKQLSQSRLVEDIVISIP